MNISFDKALLWLIPYLYIISVTYYWGFWGAFNIDAFDYYAASDLVKGVVAPIGTPAALSAIAVFGVLVSAVSINKLNEWVEKKKISISIRIGIIILFTFGFIIIYQIAFALFVHKRTFTIPYDENHLLVKLNAFLIIPVFILSFYIASIYDAYKSFNHFIAVVIYMGFLLYLPGQGFLSGKENAMRISQNKEFNYVIADGLAGPKGFYKYLGKTGDYYILVTLDNVKHVIVPVDELKPLVIEQYSLDIPASIRRFRIHMKQLTAPITQKETLKK